VNISNEILDKSVKVNELEIIMDDLIKIETVRNDN